MREKRFQNLFEVGLHKFRGGGEGNPERDVGKFVGALVAGGDAWDVLRKGNIDDGDGGGGGERAADKGAVAGVVRTVTAAPWRRRRRASWRLGMMWPLAMSGNRSM